MMTPLIAAQIIALVSTGLVGGIFLGHRAGVTRASTRLPAGSFIQLQQIIHQVFQRMMPPLVLVSLLGTLVWTFLARTHEPVVAFWLLLLASAGLLLAAALTRAVNIPINRQLMSWSSKASPPEFAHVWSRWERIHSIRTPLVIAAFVCQTVAVTLFAPGSV